MKIAVIAVPYISVDNHLHFAKQTMQSIFSAEHEIVTIGVINKLRNEEDREWVDQAFDHVIENDKNALARAWNKGLDKAWDLQVDYAIVINLDIIFQKDCIDNLVTFGEIHKDAVIWTALEAPNEEVYKFNEKDFKGSDYSYVRDSSYGDCPHFSLFMMSRISQLLLEKDDIDRVNAGSFDEQYIPAYYEDNDMHYRINKSGWRALGTHAAKFIHFGSRTISEDEKLRLENNSTFMENQNKYIAKWGGLPGQERFIAPYNRIYPKLTSKFD